MNIQSDSHSIPLLIRNRMHVPGITPGIRIVEDANITAEKSGSQQSEFPGRYEETYIVQNQYIKINIFLMSCYLVFCRVGKNSGKYTKEQ